jgi:hypothetical protein
MVWQYGIESRETVALEGHGGAAAFCILDDAAYLLKLRVVDADL